MKGRPPVPTEVKRRTGNPGKRDLQAPVVVAGRALDKTKIPEAPEHLDEEGALLWKGYAEYLADAGILDLADLPALTAMVEAELMAADAYWTYQEEGPTVPGARGGEVIHPAFKVWKEARRTHLRYAEQFGLTPSARARLGLQGLLGRKLRQDLNEGLPAHPRSRSNGGGG